MIYSNVEFIQTCSACPEQYDIVVKVDGRTKGYIHLRYGSLTVEYNGKPIYHYEFPDKWKGCFNGQDERTYFLNKIKSIINDIDRYNYYEE